MMSCLKVGLVVALIAQNATLNVSARRARVAAVKQELATGCPFQSTTVVVTVECLKALVALALLCVELGPLAAVRTLWDTTVNSPIDSAKILVPAGLYTVTNNLVLVAADLLEGPLLALFGQLKILTTGLFSVLILRRELGVRRWLALHALTLGVLVVQVSKREGGGDEGNKNIELGLAVVTVSCFIAGFAGVYFELVLKTSPVSLWIRQVHLASLSVVVGAIAIVLHHRSRTAVIECGYFAGYDNSAVLLYVAVQAGGGLLIGGVIKYADNLVKNFANAVSLIFIALISFLFYGFVLTPLFFAGGAAVIYAILLYADLLKDLPLYRRLPPQCGGAADGDASPTKQLAGAPTHA